MSADNFIKISEDENGEYDVREYFSDGGELENIGHFTNLREALEAAQTFQEENEVEYGIIYRAHKSHT